MKDYVIKGSEFQCYTGTNKSIEIPKGIVTIAFPAFCGNEHIQSITVPDGVRYIMDGAFRGCRSLRTVVLPSSIKAIGKNAFLKCDNLKTIIYSGDDKQWECIYIDESNLEYLYQSDISLSQNSELFQKRLNLKRKAVILNKRLESLEQELSASDVTSNTDDEKWQGRIGILHAKIQLLEEVDDIRSQLRELVE